MPEDADVTPEARFTGLTGGFKQWATMGVIGVLAGLTCYLVMVQMPAMHESHLRTIEKTQAEANLLVKEERMISQSHAEKSRQHGGEVSKELSEGLRENAKAISSLNETFIRVQERTQANQQRMIELQIEKMKKDEK